MTRFFLIFTSAVALSACASVTEAPRAAAARTGEVATNVGSASASAVRQTRAGLKDAALSPLEDFNLKRDKIPGRLASLDNPYHVPEILTCEEVAVRIAQLDAVLGEDWDAPEDAQHRSQRLANGAADATLKALSSEARGIIPFRGVVRMATGASKHEKAYNRAFQIGAHRRTYLKGYGMALGCDAPARPLPGVEASVDAYQNDTLQQPVIVGLPEATSSDQDVSTQTHVELAEDAATEAPLVTYRSAPPEDASEAESESLPIGD